MAKIVSFTPCIAEAFVGDIVTLQPSGKWKDGELPTVRVEVGTERVAQGSRARGPKHARCRLDDLQGLNSGQARELAVVLLLAAGIMEGNAVEVPGYVT